MPEEVSDHQGIRPKECCSRGRTLRTQEYTDRAILKIRHHREDASRNGHSSGGGGGGWGSRQRWALCLEIFMEEAAWARRPTSPWTRSCGPSSWLQAERHLWLVARSESDFFL